MNQDRISLGDTMRHPNVWWLALLGLLTSGCSDLDSISDKVCGNGAVDPSNGEDCDRFSDPALGEGTRCAAPDTPAACRYICGEAQGGAVCPDGWGCGTDGLCRRASGGYAEAPRSPIPPTFGLLSLADVDGDRVPDLIAGDFDGVKVRYGTALADYTEVAGISLTLQGQAEPMVANFDGVGGADPIFIDRFRHLLLAATGTPEKTLRPAPFPASEVTSQDQDAAGPIFYVPMAAGTDRLQQLLRIELRADGATLRFVNGETPREDPAPAGEPYDLSFIDFEKPMRFQVGNVDADAADELLLAIDGQRRVRVFGAALDGSALPVVQAPVEVVFPGPVFNTGVDLADVNGDSRLDVVGVYVKANGSLGVAYFLGNGAGAFGAVTLDTRFDTALGGNSAYFRFERPYLLGGDVNGDKRADFLVGNGDVEFAYLYYIGGTYVAGATHLLPLTLADEDFFFLDAATGDFNRDGFADFVMTTESGLDFRKGSAGALLNQHFVPTGQFPSGLRVGDFDGDRLDDVAFLEGSRNQNGFITAKDLLRVAYGSVELPGPEPVSVAAWAEVQGLAPTIFGGLSQDATRDLSVAYSDNQDRLWLAELRGRGDRTFLAPLAVDFEQEVLIAGRFDASRDAALDLLVLDATRVGTTDAIKPILLQGGKAGFVLDQPIESNFFNAVVPECFARFRAGAAADLDDDGIDEALVFYECTETSPLMLSVVRLGGLCADFVQSVTNFQLSAEALDPVRVDVGDIDGDGKLDVLVPYIGPSFEGALLVWNDILAGDGTSPNPTDVRYDNLNDLALINADADPGKELAVLVGSVVGIADVVDRQVQPTTAVLSLTDSTGRLLVGDVNLDGLDDLIAFPQVLFATPFDPAREARTTCDLATQIGCGPGETCDLNGVEIECRVAGTGMETDECEFINECAAGYSCIATFSLGRSSCLKWCDSDDDCQGPGGVCDLPINASGIVIPGAVTCTPNCDPLSNEGCPAGWGCKVYLHSDGTRSETLCTPAGAGLELAPCANEAECAPGFSCVNDPGTCGQNCLFGTSPDGCPGGTTCVGYTTPHVIGGVEYGVCL